MKHSKTLMGLTARYLVLCSLSFMAMVGCVPGAAHITLPFTSTQTFTALPPTQTPAPSATFTLTATTTPTETPTPTLTSTPTITPTPTWVFNTAGKVVAPILLYHHIAENGQPNRYYVPPAAFEAQMQVLKEWGYTSITISRLLDALIYGAELPEKPVVITFDDGDLDVYQNAFPIMQKYGYTGVFYIVANRLRSEGFVSVEQLKEMAAAGWEIGSHGMSHKDLTETDNLAYEMLDSRLLLEQEVGVEVRTIAYPFGKVNPRVLNHVEKYGYRSGLGLGTLYTHTWGTLYYLSRIEIQADYSIEQIGTMLPYPGKP